MTTPESIDNDRELGSGAETLWATTYDAPFGELTLVASDAGLRAVLWPNEAPNRVTLAATIQDPTHPVLRTACAQLDEYFDGDRTEFQLLLDPRGTEFQLAAWHALAEIPFGETVTYAEQARRIGRPTAVRAIGAANGRNPLSIVLPCHRVVGSDGSLTGFAAGLDAKQWLLTHESGARPEQLRLLT